MKKRNNPYKWDCWVKDPRLGEGWVNVEGAFKLDKEWRNTEKAKGGGNIYKKKKQ